MNQGAKTLTFVGVALAAIGLAFATYPRPDVSAESEIGQPLFPKLAQLLPSSVKELAVTNYDEKQAAFDKFEVKQVNGRWVLPSHQSYPADATQHMVDAAKAVMGLKIENVVSNKPSEHAEYGVVEPDPKKIKPGETGIGKQISVNGDNQQSLANFIVGKSPKDKNDYRYVRQPGNNTVYLVKVNPDNWSTQFGDWIEKKLLKLDPWNIKEIVIRDYNVELGVRGGRVGISKYDRRGEATLEFDDTKSEWKLVKFEQTDPKAGTKDLVPTADEELVIPKLNDLKTALDDLKIVDVERKPAGLEGSLEDFLKKSEDAAQSLFERGFYPVGDEQGKANILSGDGEIIVRMKSGVEYTLHFGAIAGTSQETGKDKKDAKPDDKGDKEVVGKEKTSVNRYIFVMAKVNEDLIPKPMLEVVSADAAPEKKPDEKDAGKPAETDKKADPAKSDAKSDADPKKDEAKPEDVEKKEDPELTKKRIEADNKRKLEEYQSKLKQAQDKVKDLNKRFGDWYYVVPDSEYKKIHLGRNDFVHKKEKPKGQGDGADDFNELQKGIDKKPDAAPVPDAPKK